ncbi:MAG: hypothetical protein AAFR11_12735 [Pseudomonadota bacterium]
MVRLLTPVMAAFLTVSCASVDLIGAYRLSRQDYETVDPALWRAAVLHPMGADISYLHITLKDDEDPEDVTRLEFVKADEAPASELPTPDEDEILAIYRVDPMAVEEARRLQKIWLQEEGNGDRSLGVNVSYKLTKSFERAWCEDEADLVSPVWVRIEPTARFRRILKPDALDKVMKPASKERCAAVLTGDEDPPGVTATESVGG